MRPIHRMLRTADDDAWQQGHAVVWQAFNERNAHGRCTACGREVTASLHGATITTSGDALNTPCTRDLIPKEPTLQRPTPEPRPKPERTRFPEPTAAIAKRHP